MNFTSLVYKSKQAVLFNGMDAYTFIKFFGAGTVINDFCFVDRYVREGVLERFNTLFESGYYANDFTNLEDGEYYETFRTEFVIHHCYGLGDGRMLLVTVDDVGNLMGHTEYELIDGVCPC
ncbi:hypothetical protein GCM10023184_29470 [Flaviaesturariibacter amylovorans]|uniref:PAS domain-containing protein n=1 Tax=Flaviaesturariibacter amylovorans TaxID=1084520 RepID=A0ABP8H680_9BACT